MDELDGLIFLPCERWPEFDRRAWAKAHARGGYFNDDGLLAHLAPATDERCEKEWGQLLLFQTRTNMLRDVKRIGHRVSREVDLRPFLDFMLDRYAPKSVAASFGHIAQVVRELDPTFDRELLLRAWRRLQRTAKPVRKIDDRLISPKTLWGLGIAMMDEAETVAGLTDKERAVLFRDGLLIAFLAVCPLRRRNAVALREDEHLEIEDGSSQLRIPAEQMKSHKRDFIASLRPELVVRLQRFWKHFRPILAWRPGTDETVLWLTMRGTAMRPDTMSDRIERIVFERLQRQFSCHNFRHSAVTFIVDVAPDLALLAVGVLGHGQFKTANEHYIRGQQIAAVTSFQDEVIAIIERGGGLADSDV